MSVRKVTDEDGRTWTCKPEDSLPAAPGRDVLLFCTTPALKDLVVKVKVSWQWLKMAERGLARMIVDSAPAHAH